MTQNVCILNATNHGIHFKVQSTDPSKFKIMPPHGYLLPHANLSISGLNLFFFFSFSNLLTHWLLTQVTLKVLSEKSDYLKLNEKFKILLMVNESVNTQSEKTQRLSQMVQKLSYLLLDF